MSRVTVFTGGPIVTMDRPAETVVVADGRIVEVGPRRLEERDPDATIVDLAGRSLLPGFVDAHNHLSLAALRPRWADLEDAADLEDVAGRIADQARREPEAEWVRASGWEARHRLRLTRHDLDSIGLDRPVMVAHYSLHQCVVSTRGLDALGIGTVTPDPPGGLIEREADGSLSGVLRERAFSEAHARSIVPYSDPDRWSDLIESHARTLLADGITAIHDAACHPAAEDAYRRLASEGRLPLSVLTMPHGWRFLDGPGDDRLDGQPSGEGDEWLRVGAVKLFADGGAYPWIDAVRKGRRRQMGIPFPPIAGQALDAARRGFDVAIHAMGNAGLAAAIATCELVAARYPTRRLRIEHVTLASPEQIDSMSRLGVTAVVQPGFIDTVGRNVHSLTFEQATWMPFADLKEREVRLAGSSDHPPGPAAPLASSILGVTRTTADGDRVAPHQSVPMDEWLRAWTIGSAEAGGQEGERGSLTPGKRADLVIVEGPLDGSGTPRVAETWVAGRRRFPPHPFRLRRGG